MGCSYVDSPICIRFSWLFYNLQTLSFYPRSQQIGRILKPLQKIFETLASTAKLRRAVYPSRSFSPSLLINGFLHRRRPIPRASQKVRQGRNRSSFLSLCSFDHWPLCRHQEQCRCRIATRQVAHGWILFQRSTADDSLRIHVVRRWRICDRRKACVGKSIDGGAGAEEEESHRRARSVDWRRVGFGRALQQGAAADSDSDNDCAHAADLEAAGEARDYEKWLTKWNSYHWFFIFIVRWMIRN